MILEPALRSDERHNDGQNDNDRGPATEQKQDFGGHREHLLPSEAEVLEGFGRAAVETRRSALVTAARSEIALGDPGCGAV